ncbi:hypothetical protein ACES2J_16230 [Bdellovibrio bacteriovorus]|uniref:hypothetical protein n=1 Tax=Bdellovibrio bacteriovorus TaxID=959 RepID=UPI0035A5F448
MKPAIFFVLLAFVGLAFWGCPTRKYIPDPTPPQPEVQIQSMRYDEVLRQHGQAPWVGPRQDQRRMLAMNF